MTAAADMPMQTAERALALDHAVALRADGRGRIVEALGACERMLGRDRAAVGGAQLVDTLDADWWAQVAPAWERLTNADTATEELELAIGQAADPRLVRWHAERIADDDYLLLAVDVTNRRRREASLRRLVDQLPLLIAYIDRDLVYRYSNAAHRARFAQHGSSVLGLRVPDVLGEATFRRVRPCIEQALAGEISGHRFPLTGADGTTIETHTDYMPDLDEGGSVRGFYVVVQDVTEYRSTIDLMRAAHRVTARQDAPVDEMIGELLTLGTRHFGMPLGIVSRVAGEQYRVDHLSGGGVQETLHAGLELELDHTCCRNLVATDDVFDFHDRPPVGTCDRHPGFGGAPPACYIGAPLFVRGRFHGTVSFAGDEARQAPFTEIDRELARLLAGAISSLIARAQYESQLEEANQRLLLEASTDALTGAYSRRFIDEILEREVEIAGRHGRKLTVAMLDLDRFKGINDRHGHDTGDEVLRAVSRACADELRQSDVLARFGGEEFVVMLPETSLSVAAHVCERLRHRVAELRVAGADDESIQLTGSFGVSSMRTGDTSRELLRRADRALYRAKREGRNRVVTG